MGNSLALLALRQAVAHHGEKCRLARFNVRSLRVLRDSVVEVSYKKAQKNTAPGGTGAAGWKARYYQAKWAKALLASAIRWTFSRRVMAAPSRL